MIADFDARCVQGDDRLWRFQSHLLNPFIVGGDLPASIAIWPRGLRPNRTRGILIWVSTKRGGCDLPQSRVERRLRVDPRSSMAARRTAGIGASSSLLPIPAKVGSPNGQRTLGFGGENWSSCPTPVVRRLAPASHAPRALLNLAPLTRSARTYLSASARILDDS